MRRLVLVATVLLALGCDAKPSTDRGSAAPAATAGAAAEAPVLTGQVTRDGEPVAGAFLVVSEVESGLVPADLDPRDLFTGDDGSFRLELAPGSYKVIAIGPNGWRAEADVDLEGEQALSLALAEDRQAVIDFIQNGPAEPSEGAE